VFAALLERGMIPPRARLLAWLALGENISAKAMAELSPAQ